MSTVGIAMVKDEADVIGATVEHMLTQVDEIVIADNGSTDGTRDILADLPVRVIDDPELGYYQSQKMTKLAHQAGFWHEWVVPFDADEWWYSQFFPRVAELLDSLADQWFCAAATLYDHVSTAKDPDEPNPIKRLGWRRIEPTPLPKVACRTRGDLVIGQGNHNAHYDGGATVYADHLVVRHFPYRSPEQFVSKVRNGAAAYAATDLPDNIGAHWRGYGAILRDCGEQALIDDVFRTWFYSKDPHNDPTLIFDPCPMS